jgi:tripartite-type tricarboxylate transporter receptor subunit TctC
MGIQPLASTPEEFGAFLRTEVARWSKVVRDAGAQVE